MPAACQAAPRPTLDTSRLRAPRVLTPAAKEILAFALLHPAREFSAIGPFAAAARRARGARRNALRLAARRAVLTLQDCGLLFVSRAAGATRYQLTPTFAAATLAARLLLTRD